MNNPLLQSVQLALHNGAQAEAIELIDKVVDFCIKHENGKVLDGWPRDLIQLLVGLPHGKGHNTNRPRTGRRDTGCLYVV
jgi:hypothetical protein